MTHGWCTVCEKWGAHIAEECKWLPDPLGRRLHYCEVCDSRRVVSKQTRTCRTRGCIGSLNLSTVHDVGPKKLRRKS
jgi:hypothetical protein